jgi:hypothetical protein
MYKKWSWFFEKFFWLIDRENGNYLRMPFEIDTLSQPAKTMAVFDLMKEYWIEKLIADQKKASK